MSEKFSPPPPPFDVYLWSNIRIDVYSFFPSAQQKAVPSTLTARNENKSE